MFEKFINFSYGGTDHLVKLCSDDFKKIQPKKIVIFSRDEIKQWEMEKEYEKDSR